MMMRNVMKVMVLAAGLSLAGCGGGGGSATPSATTAKVRLSTVAKASITSINGVQVTVQMPAGVTVKADAQGKYATASGQFAGKIIETNYQPPGIEPAKLSIIVASAESVSVGEFATFTVDVPAGSTVTKSSFTILKPVKIPYSPNTGTVADVPEGDVVVEADIVP